MVARGGESAALHLQALLNLRELGLHVNMEKSVLAPSKSIKYLGMDIDTTARPTFRVTQAKPKKIRHDISRSLRAESLTARHLARLAGVCVSTLRPVLPGRMLLRNVYRQLAATSLDSTIELSLGSTSTLTTSF